MSSTLYEVRLERIADQAEEARKKTAEAVALVKADTDHTEEWKREEVNKLQRRLLETSQQLAAEMREARDALLAEAVNVKDTRDQTERLLADQRAGRKWAEIRDRLDKGHNWSRILDVAVEAGDQATMDALSTELPSYLAAKVPAGADPRDHTRRTLADTRRALDAVLAEHAEGTTREAAAIRHRSHRLIANTAREVNAAEATALGRFNQMAYGIEKHYAAQAEQAEAAAAEARATQPDVFGALAGVIQDHYL